ncbi:hypothetical protein LCGC14_1201740 [marine sediment metagenome]|uniref:Uncharacterized protein n=1 Tax=marine sediment metagenome TaxID=412755 RepID=A0A0F9LL44_9ZZZZ
MVDKTMILRLTVNWFENINPKITKQQAISEAELYLKTLHSQGVVIRGQSLGGSHPHLAAYYTVESLIKGE